MRKFIHFLTLFLLIALIAVNIVAAFLGIPAFYIGVLIGDLVIVVGTGIFCIWACVKVGADSDRPKH